MAEPIKFQQANDVLLPPENMTEEQCATLPIFRGKTSDMISDCVVSCWQLSDEELEEVKRTGKVFVGALGKTHPPIFIMGKFPQMAGTVHTPINPTQN